MKGIAYGVGVGPGDPKLMTLRAIELIRENDVIAVPGKEPKESVAYKIAAAVVPEIADKELVPVYMPMIKDRAFIDEEHKNGAALLKKYLDQGKNVVYITLGDPTIYCTFSYLQHYLEADGYPVKLVENDRSNFKITTPEDVDRARMQAGGSRMRIGHGYDVHRLVPDRRLVLGGVEIPWEKGLLGHSDADVALHALMDAMLGAAAMGDIGRLFPDSDPAYEGISSMKLMEEVRDRIYEKGFRISNVDVTIICERPKVSPYIPEMTEKLASVLGIETDKINIKGTTTEKLGFTGRGEGIASQAVCTLLR